MYFGLQVVTQQSIVLWFSTQILDHILLSTQIPPVLSLEPGSSQTDIGVIPEEPISVRSTFMVKETILYIVWF